MGLRIELAAVLNMVIREAMGSEHASDNGLVYRAFFNFCFQLGDSLSE